MGNISQGLIKIGWTGANEDERWEKRRMNKWRITEELLRRNKWSKKKKKLENKTKKRRNAGREEANWWWKREGSVPRRERGLSAGVVGMQSPSHYFPVHQAADFCFSCGPQRFRSTAVFLSLRVKLRHTAPSVIITSHREFWWTRPTETQSSDLIQLWMDADFI